MEALGSATAAPPVHPTTVLPDAGGPALGAGGGGPLKKNSTSLDARARDVRHRLRLVPGGEASPGTVADGALDSIDPVREPIVRRARQRLAAGYYARPEVVERLVELLWDEFHTR